MPYWNSQNVWSPVKYNLQKNEAHVLPNANFQFWGFSLKASIFFEVWFPAHSQFHLDVNQEHAALLHQVDDKHDEPRHLHQSSHPKKIVDSEDPPVSEMFHLKGPSVVVQHLPRQSP